jgi:uncharacterized protein
MTAPVPWRREDGGDLVLLLHVQPGARRTAVAGLYGAGVEARLKVALAAPPVDGKANAALLRHLAAAFGVPQKSVTLERGETSRQKTVRIARPALRPDESWALASEGERR